MSDHNQPSRYRAYLLRCWQERGRRETEPPLWRFSLEDPHTGRRHGFATLEAVVEALQQELGVDGEPTIDTSRPAMTQTEEED